MAFFCIPLGNCCVGESAPNIMLMRISIHLNKCNIGRQQDVRATEIDKVDMHSSFGAGDIVRALVVSLITETLFCLNIIRRDEIVVCEKTLKEPILFYEYFANLDFNCFPGNIDQNVMLFFSMKFHGGSF